MLAIFSSKKERLTGPQTGANIVATPVFSNMFEINTLLDYRLLPSYRLLWIILLSIVIDFANR